MPKQIYKIENFHGGLNTDSDPRDVADNELPVLTDLVVDEMGKIRMMGGLADHGAPDPTDGTLRAGYGLFYFTADRKGAHVIEDDLSGEHTSTDSSTTLTDSSSTWPVDGLIGATVNNTTDASSGVITDNTPTQLLTTLAGGGDNSWDDTGNDDYTINKFPETGDDYLVHVDCDSTSAVMIYSRLSDTWSNANYPINLGSTANVEPTFYAVDGGLRVSDGNFGLSNTNHWYSYINREYFQSLGGNTVTIDQWKSLEQKISEPAASSKFDEAAAAGGTAYSTVYVDLSQTTDDDLKKYETEDQIFDDSSGQGDVFANVSNCNSSNNFCFG